MKNKSFLFFILFLFMISSIRADFWEMHLRDTEISINMPPDSFLKQIARDNEDVVLSCNAGTDATVIWYLNNDATYSYQQSHVRRAYEVCNELAGNDEELKACCIGIGTHHTQDSFGSHGYQYEGGKVEGFTPECIRRYWGSNIILHAACEDTMTDKVLSSLSTNEQQRIILAAGNAYNLFDEEDTSTEEYENRFARLLSASFGFMSRDQYFTGEETDQSKSFYNAIFIVGGEVQRGQGHGYLNIYKERTQIPAIWYIIPIIGIIIFALIILAMLWFGQNKWKYVGVTFSGIVMAAFILFITAVTSGTAFGIFRSFATFVPSIGWGFIAAIGITGILVGFKFTKLLKGTTLTVFSLLLIFSLYVLFTTNFGIIDIPNYQEYRERSITETNNFLVSEQLFPFDASGFTYTDNSGQEQEGTLIQAEHGFDFIKWILIGSIVFLITVLFIAMRQD